MPNQSSEVILSDSEFSASVLEKLASISESQVRMEERQLSHVEKMDTVIERVNGYSKRLRFVEIAVATFTGGITLIGYYFSNLWKKP